MNSIYPNLQGNNDAYLVREDIVDGLHFPTDLLSMVKAHLRIVRSNTGEDALLLQYIAAAIEAAEQYLGKDVIQRNIEIQWFGGGPLYLTRGRITDLQTVNGDSPAEDIFPTMRVAGSMTFKGGGLALMPTGTSWQTADANNYRRVIFKSGFAAVADIPPAVISFILVATGMLYEVRELANVSEGTAREYNVSALPTFLLEAFETKVMA